VLPAVVATGLLVLVLVLPLPLAEDEPDELHAARTAAAAAMASTASSIRSGFGALSRVSEVIIAFLCSWARPLRRGTLTIPAVNPTMPRQRSRHISASPQASPPASPNHGLLATPKPGGRGTGADPGYPEPLAEMSACRDGERRPGATFRYLRYGRGAF
jgi:hypothetical protein